MLRIAIAEPDRTISGPLGQAVSADAELELIASAADARALLTALGDKTVDVMIVDVAAAGVEPSGVMREIVERHPGTLIIATGKGPSAGTVGRMIAAGAATFMPKPYRPDELFATARELRRAPRPATASTARLRRGSLIAVYSPKGGVGTTTVATSLAVALAARPKTRVAIVDLDLQFGDVGVALDLKAQNGIGDLLAVDAPIDDAMIAEVFARHSSGVHALLAPQDPTDLGSVDVPEIMRLLDRMRGAFDHVVVDLWSALEDLAMQTLRNSDRVVLVTTPEVPSLRHIRRIMNATGTLLGSDRTFIVANRAPAKVGVSISEIERVLGMPVAARIPSDGVGVTKAINEGRSLMDPRASLRVAKAFRGLADAVAKDLAERKEAALAAKTAAVAS